MKLFYLTIILINFMMKKSNILLITFWSLAAIIVAWLLPFMARNSNVANDFLSYCLTFIQ